MPRRKQQYSADRPIQSKTDDLLGRVKFATELANDIQSWKGKDSLVLALYGTWGCGKTSVKNMLLEANSRRRNRTIPVIDFNPWQLSGSGAIPLVFFKELEIALNKSGQKPDIERRSKKLREYASKLDLFAKMTKIMARVAPAFVNTGADVETFATGVEGAATIVQSGSEALQAESEANSKGLSEQKRDLGELLKELPKPILVVIDDIDRLTTDEILQVFQLVKANADFPNLIYLLLFEREVVATALDRISGNKGAEFLEKIVQVGYHIPHASQNAVQKVFFAGLDRCMDNSPALKLWDKRRWAGLYTEISGYFRNLRHVYRFLSSFEFHTSQHQSTNSFEVNPVDLIGLETLRVFEPLVYECLPGAKTILTRYHGFSLFVEIKQTVVDESLSQILAAARPDVRNRIKKILLNLFPPITEAYSGKYEVSRDHDEWLRQRRICHPEFFDKYFTLMVPADDLSQAELDNLLALTGDKASFVSACIGLRHRGLLKIAFARLDAYKEAVPLHHMPALTEALCDLSDSIPEQSIGYLEPDLESHAWRLVYFGLKRENSFRRRFEVIRDAITRTIGLALPIQIVSLEERVGDREQSGHQFLLEDADLPELKQICVEKLRRASKEKEFLENPRLRIFLWRWSDWAGIDEVRTWIAEQVKSPKAAVWLLNCLLGELHVSGINESTIKYYIDLSVVERFANIDKLAHLASGLDQSTLTKEERRAVKAFHEAIKRRTDGKPDDAWKHDVNDGNDV